MKKPLALLLALALLLSTALAAEVFPAKNDYPGFTDVAATDSNWYYAAVKTCVETGLMKGAGDGNFNPAGDISVAEVAVIAARICAAIAGEEILEATPLPTETWTWYYAQTKYLKGKGVTLPENLEVKATRADFVRILGEVLPKDQLAAINSITALPDTSDTTVLRFYNAGILTGTDVYGTFQAAGSLTRAETAVMVARVTAPTQRKHFVPQEKPKDDPNSVVAKVLGIPGSTTILTVDGTPVTAETYCSNLVNTIFYQDNYQYQNNGSRLDWSYDYGVGELGAYFKQMALNATVTQVVEGRQATLYGVKAEALPALLFPSGTAAELDAYVEAKSILRAKHILLPTINLETGDPLSEQAQAEALSTATSLYELLKDDNSQGLFDALMKEYSQDGGLQSNPNGYLFTPGQMVAEFETGTKALAIGQVGPPVKSSFGYHVILRLDPKGDASLATNYQADQYQAQLTQWLKAADVRGTDLYTNLNAKEYYEKALPYYAA